MARWDECCALLFSMNGAPNGMRHGRTANDFGRKSSIDFDEVSVVRRWSGPDRLREESGRFCPWLKSCDDWLMRLNLRSLRLPHYIDRKAGPCQGRICSTVDHPA